MEAFRLTFGIMVPSHTNFINMTPKCLTTRYTLQDASSSCLVTQQRQVLMKTFSSLKVVLQKEYKESWSTKYKCSASETDNYAITNNTSQCLAQKKRFAVFVSGGGSNFRAIHQAAKDELVNGDISVLVTDKPHCGGAEYARENQIPVVIYPSSKSSRDGVSASELIATLRLKYAFKFGNGVKQVRTCEKLINGMVSSWGQIVGLLHTCYRGVEFEGVCCKKRFEVDFLLLAGYLKLIPVELVRAYPKSIINIHPSLLPAFGGKGFYGLKVHEAVIASGARYSGPTIHFVDEHYDTGRILAQRVVPVLADDTAEKLAARVLHQEHQLYLEVVSALCEDRIIWREDGVPLIRRKENPDKLY